VISGPNWAPYRVMRTSYQSGLSGAHLRIP
jgi:hypothetical protein